VTEWGRRSRIEVGITYIGMEVNAHKRAACGTPARESRRELQPLHSFQASLTCLREDLPRCAASPS
jgi:hypothetical protein